MKQKINKILYSKKKTLLLFLVCFVFMFLFSREVYGATHYLTENITGTITPSSFTPNVKPGDTIIITADRTTGFGIRNMHGTAERPITFTNPSDGVATITAGEPSGGISPGQAITIVDSSNIKILGNNNPNKKYGIVISRESTIGPTSGIRFFCVKSFEVGHVHIEQPAIGSPLYNATFGPISQNSNGNPNLSPPWPCADPWDGDSAEINAGRNGDSRIHHCLLENMGGEIYLGKNNPLITGYNDHDLYPSWTTLEIDNNRIINGGADGMQMGRIDTGGWMKVHDNYIYGTGLDYVIGDEPRPNPNWTYNIGINTTYNIKGPAYIYNNEVHYAGGTGIYCEWSNNIAEISDNIITYPGQDTYYSHGFDGIGIAGGTPGTSKIVNNTIIGATENAIDVHSSDDGFVGYNFNVETTSPISVRAGTSVSQLNNVTVANIAAAKFDSDNEANPYSLTSDSPAKDAGTAAGYSATDIKGTARYPFIGAGADAGAYEYTGETSVPSAPLGLMVQ